MAAAQTIAVVEAGGRTVSLGSVLGPAFASDRSMFSIDEFHPSAVGYAQAAAVLLPSVADAVGRLAGRGRPRRPADPPRHRAPGRRGRGPGRQPHRHRGPAGRGARLGHRPPRVRGRCCAAAGRPEILTAEQAEESARGHRGRRAEAGAAGSAASWRALPRSSFGGDPTSADRPRDPPHRGGPMPEAVIVATARSPIGRAFKGSLKDLRPDDLAATIVRAALDKVPALDPADIDDLMLGCGLPGGEQGYNMGRVVASCSAWTTCRGRRSPATAPPRCRPPAWPCTRSRPARATSFISAGVEMVSRFVKGNSDSLPDTQNPVFADAAGPRGQGRRERRRHLARPARGRRRPRHLHRDGPDRGEPGAAARTSPGRRWTSSPSAARTSPRRRSTTASGSGRSPRSPRRTAPSSARTTARAPAPRSRASPALKPVFRPDGRATAGNACPLNDGAAAVVVMSDTKAARARPDPAGPHRLDRGHRPVAGDHGLRPGRRLEAGPAAGRHEHRRHRPGRDQRGVRRAGHPQLPRPRHRHRPAERARRRDRRRATRSA